MKPDEIFELMGQIEDELIEEASQVKVNRKSSWVRYAITSAAILLLLFAISSWWQKNQTPDSVPPLAEVPVDSVEESDLPLLQVSLGSKKETSPQNVDSWGLLPQSTGNPYEVTDAIDHITIYENHLALNQGQPLSENSLRLMKERLREVSQSLGIHFEESSIEDIQYPYSRTDLSEYRVLVYDSELYQLSVDSGLNLTIEVKTPIQLDPVTNEEEAITQGQRLLTQYPELFNGSQLMVTLQATEDFTENRADYILNYFEIGDDPAETITNFSLNRTIVIVNGNQVHLVHQMGIQRSNSRGSFPVITSEEAVEQFLAGSYYSLMPTSLPTKDQILRMELEILPDNNERFYLPYYRLIIRQDGRPINHCFVPALTEQSLTELTQSIPDYETNNDLTVSYQEELFYAHDPTELITGNPWREHKLTNLPVIAHKQRYALNGTLLPQTRQRMIERLSEVSHHLGIDFQKSDVLTEQPLSGGVIMQWVGETHGLSVTPDLTVTIQYLEPKTLPSEYKLSHRATPDELMQTGQYLGNELKTILGMSDPVVAIEHDSFRPEAKSTYLLSLYQEDKDPVEKLLNHQLNRVYPSGMATDSLIYLRIQQTDLSERVGNYPIISLDEATKQLFEDNYLSFLDDTFTKDSTIGSVEIIYRETVDERMSLPYYRFLIELPERMDHGMKAYGAYYVPAIESKYLRK